MLIFRNFGYLTLGRLLGDAFAFAFLVVLARTYGDEGVGNYGFALAITSVLVVLADFGLHNSSVKDISRDKAQFAVYYGSRVAIRLMLCAGAFVLLAAVVAADLPWFAGELRWVILLIGTYQILLSLIDGIYAVFVAHEDMRSCAMLEFSLRSTTSMFAIAIALTGGSLVAAVASLPVMCAIHIAIGWRYAVKRFGELDIAAGVSEAARILHSAVPYALHSMLSQFATRTTVVFVGFMLGAGQAGLFNVAHRAALLVLMLPTLAGLALLPAASRLHASEPGGFVQLCRSSVGLAVLASVPMAVGIWLIAPRLIHGLYGTEFDASIGVLRWLSGMVVLVFLRMLFEYLLIACERQKGITMVHVLATAVSLAAHYVLIRSFGLAGAAGAMLLLEALLAVSMGIMLMRRIGWLRIGSRIVISVTGSMAFCVPLFLTDPPLLITIPAAVFVYSLVLLLFEDIRFREVNMLRNWIASTSGADAPAPVRD